MRIFARLLEKLYRVAAKYRSASIVAGVAALAPSFPGVIEPAWGLDECGPLDAAGNVTCPAGNYPTGVGYDTNNGLGGTPITLTLQSGVNVVIPAGAPGINAVTPLTPLPLLLRTARTSL